MTTLRDRALKEGEKFAERHHGKPALIHGKRYPTPGAFEARLAFAAGWLAGWKARGKK